MIRFAKIPLWVAIALFLTPIGVGKSNAAILELGRSVLLDDEQSRSSNVWFAYNYFNPNMDVLNFSSQTATKSKLTLWDEIKVGANVSVNESIRLRLQYVQGRQATDRPVFPKRLDSKYWGVDARLQWSTALNDAVSVGMGVGYRLHKAPAYSVKKLQQGKITITAAPGKPLFESSSSDKGWLIDGILKYKVSPAVRLHAHVEYRQVSVQVVTSSYDPFIISLLEKNQSPQTTPWQEEHLITSLGLDWQMFSPLSLAMNIRQYNIKRINYIPRTKFQDYNNTTQVDLYFNYTATDQWQIFTHMSTNTHFLLGDYPALYNRRNNHTFKSPFGYVSLGLIYQY